MSRTASNKCGGSYRLEDTVVAVLLPMWERVLGGPSPGADAWERMLVASGR
jgi:hypothetical protein